MKTYVTKIIKGEDEYEGPAVMAYSWWEAEGIVARLKDVILCGVLD